MKINSMMSSGNEFSANFHALFVLSFFQSTHIVRAFVKSLKKRKIKVCIDGEISVTPIGVAKPVND